MKSFSPAVCCASLLAAALLVSAGRAQDALSGPVNVVVDTSKPGNFMAPRAFGIHTSVYDGALSDPKVASLLHDDGIYTLRYPGGGYADLYHWSVNKLNNWKRTGKPGYLAQNTDFGHFVRQLDRMSATAVLTVNYGTNIEGSGPGEPAEAAAWVAYCNGQPGNPKVIGNDSTGRDWKTVGYWAAMRSSAPLATDDGYNFLRIAHPQPLNIKYWEIGNELFGNGYYGRDNGGYESDWHVPYNADEKKDAAERTHNEKLSPTAYGQGVVAFSRAMKAVDPRISIGAVLNSPPMDYTWGPDWNHRVLKAAAADIDFVIIHWYTGDYAPPDWKKLDNASLLGKPTHELPQMIGELLKEFHDDAGGKIPQLAITELGTRPFAPVTDWVAVGLFASDAYISLATDGAVNIDWLELHNESFLDGKDESPKAVYFGLQAAHQLANMRDIFVTASSNNDLVAVHAARRADGQDGILLINKDPRNSATVHIKVEGDALVADGARYDWGKGAPPDGTHIQKSEIHQAGNKFTVTVPAYTESVILLHRAQP